MNNIIVRVWVVRDKLEVVGLGVSSSCWMYVLCSKVDLGGLSDILIMIMVMIVLHWI